MPQHNGFGKKLKPYWSRALNSDLIRPKRVTAFSSLVVPEEVAPKFQVKDDFKLIVF